ncbi:hypothetical protein [Kamptonema formosum]|uniref:hypothetical protein n=1 Tax=Kamptonema formosum TaxID=331992 RepID=UPI000344DF9C|nr:hypothetical protein [Oscillatoria sp. PCC 10802]
MPVSRGPKTPPDVGVVKTMIYMPTPLRASVEELAKEDNRSLSNFIVTTLQRVVDERARQGGAGDE